MKKRLFLYSIFFLCSAATLNAQRAVNYDEAKVPLYELPEVLQMNDGTVVTNSRQWEKKRRPEILNMLSEEEYGFFPKGKVKIKSRVVEQSDDALDGIAIRKQIAITLSGNGNSQTINMLVYLPKTKKKVPVFLMLNFKGNHATSLDDTSIIISNQEKRGANAHRWPFKMIVEAGYGVATAWYYDIFPDRPDGFAESVYRLFKNYDYQHLKSNDGKAIAAWAWGLSRMMDVLCKMPEVDKRKVIVAGHSRLGKTSLWAGANDKRFAIVVDNESGCGGSALSKRAFGETVATINKSFPHWFCNNFRKYNDNEEALPFDQHQLIALIAPRPIYVTSAHEDQWADPHGQYLSLCNAGPVYMLYGYEWIYDFRQPPLNQPRHGRMAYHEREGEHNVTNFDWKNYILFANKWLKYLQ